MNRQGSGVRGKGSAARAVVVLAAAFLLAACASAPAPDAPAAAAEPQVAAPPHAATTEPPQLGEPKPLTLPAVVKTVLPNGLTLLVVEHHELPIADFVLVVKSGSEVDPAGKEGLASLASALLDEGTATRGAMDIADQAAFLGVELTTASGWDASRVALHTPTAQLDGALALFADVALQPAFAANELERLRKERLTQILQIKDRGPAIADLVFSSILYGEDHPYGRWQTGTEASVTSLSRADVRTFYETFYRPNNATMIVVGDVEPADITARIESLFGAWSKGDVPAARFGAATPREGTTVYIVDKPGAPQSSFRIGSIGVARSTPDFFPLQVMNTILGGSFTSRLNQNLREEKGYTYGAGSGFAMRQEAGPFTARAEIVATKSDAALVEFMKEIRGIGEAVPGEELAKAKRYLQLQLPSQFETTEDIAMGLVPVALYGLPLDYYDTYAQRIGAVTREDVQRVARTYLDPARMAVVIVGDRKSIEEGIRAVNLGPVELRDLTGKTVP